MSSSVFDDIGACADAVVRVSKAMAVLVSDEMKELVTNFDALHPPVSSSSTASATVIAEFAECYKNVEAPIVDARNLLEKCVGPTRWGKREIVSKLAAVSGSSSSKNLSSLLFAKSTCVCITQLTKIPDLGPDKGHDLDQYMLLLNDRGLEVLDILDAAMARLREQNNIPMRLVVTSARGDKLLDVEPLVVVFGAEQAVVADVTQLVRAELTTKTAFHEFSMLMDQCCPKKNLFSLRRTRIVFDEPVHGGKIVGEGRLRFTISGEVSDPYCVDLQKLQEEAFAVVAHGFVLDPYHCRRLVSLKIEFIPNSRKIDLLFDYDRFIGTHGDALVYQKSPFTLGHTGPG